MDTALADPGCFSLIFERHFSAVFGFVGAATAVDKADDIASEVFVRAFRQRDRYNPAYTSAKPWLFGIAANLIADHYRTQARQNRAYKRLFAGDAADPGFEDDATNRLDAESASTLLEEALGSLRSQDRAVVTLFVLENMSYAEVAAALEIPVGTVRSRLNRARFRLRNLIEASGEPIRDESSE
jgi:RNA polymerase sigma-70 factor (ECF subfamily)